MQDYTANSFFFDMFALFWFSSFFFYFPKRYWPQNPPPPPPKTKPKTKTTAPTRFHLLCPTYWKVCTLCIPGKVKCIIGTRSNKMNLFFKLILFYERSKTFVGTDTNNLYQDESAFFLYTC